jgi:hypothetical protein
VVSSDSEARAGQARTMSSSSSSPSSRSCSGSLLLYGVVSTSLVLLCVLCFRDTLLHEFTFDDNLAIVNNGDVASDSNVWVNDIWGKDMRAEDSHKSYRPLLIKTFVFVAASFGMHPQYFRVISIVAHVVTSHVVCVLASTVFGNVWVGWCAAALFAAHHVHVEAVVAVVNLAEACSTGLVIISYLLFIAHTRSRGATWRQGSSSSGGGGASLGGALAMMTAEGLKFGLCVAVWCALTVAAILFKETGLVACVLIVAHTVLHGVSVVCTGMRSQPKQQQQQRVAAVERLDPPVRLVTMRMLWWNVVAGSVVATYFVFRHVLVNSSLDLRSISSGSNWDWDFASSLWAAARTFDPLGVSKSYLSTSQLIRKAENPFAFLDGAEWVLSLLVSTTYSKYAVLECCMHCSGLHVLLTSLPISFSLMPLLLSYLFGQIVPALPLCRATFLPDRAIARVFIQLHSQDNGAERPQKCAMGDCVCIAGGRCVARTATNIRR